MLFVISKLKSILKEVGAGAQGGWAPQHRPLFLYWDPWSGSAPGLTADPPPRRAPRPHSWGHIALSTGTAVHWQILPGLLSSHIPGPSQVNQRPSHNFRGSQMGADGSPLRAAQVWPAASRCPLPILSGCSPSRRELEASGAVLKGASHHSFPEPAAARPWPRQLALQVRTQKGPEPQGLDSRLLSLA